eukprot:5933318-Prymnesium_polylepis.1
MCHQLLEDPGGYYQSDGIHLTPRGFETMAKRIALAIRRHWQSRGHEVGSGDRGGAQAALSE